MTQLTRIECPECHAVGCYWCDWSGFLDATDPDIDMPDDFEPDADTNGRGFDDHKSAGTEDDDI